MRSRISIRGYVRPSVSRSVRPSVGPSVRHTRVEFLIFWLKWNKIAQRTWYYATWRTLRLKLNKRASITWNYHLGHHLKAGTRADRQNASYVCTPSDWLLFIFYIYFMVRFHLSGIWSDLNKSEPIQWFTILSCQKSNGRLLFYFESVSEQISIHFPLYSYDFISFDFISGV